MNSPITIKEAPVDDMPGHLGGLRFNLLGFVFHLSWMYLFLYVQAPAGLASVLSSAESSSPFLGMSSPLYPSSALALVVTLAAFAIVPNRMLALAHSRIASFAAPLATSTGTLMYCIFYYTGWDTGSVPVTISIASGILTGIGSGFLAARWAHAFGAAGISSVLGSAPTILAGIIAVCVTTPYLPLGIGLVLVVVLPLLSGACVSKADAGNTPSTTEAEPCATAGRTGVYAGMTASIVMLGIVLGFLNTSTASPAFSEYLVFFFLTATVAVLAACAAYILRVQRKGFLIQLVAPVCAIGCLAILLVQANQADLFTSFIPIGSACLEMLFLVTLVILAKRFGLSAVRTFALGRIAYAVSNLAGSTLGPQFAASGETTETVQIASFMLFAGVELISIAAIAVLILARPMTNEKTDVPSHTSQWRTCEPASEPTPPPSKGGRFKTKLERFAQIYQLSARETDVAEQLVKGRGYARIQQELNIAEGTVNYHTRNIYAKTDVHTREDLIDLFDSFGDE